MPSPLRSLSLRFLALAVMLLTPFAWAQKPAKPTPDIPAQDQQTLKAAGSKGFAVPAAATVHENVSVEAVLLPERVARRVFGKEISQNYAVIELTVSNSSQDNTLIVHSVYIDYRNWLLSGTTQAMVKAGLLTADNGSQDTDTRSVNVASTTSGQVASVEYRIARGEMQDQQPYTVRNRLVGGLTFLGSVASGFGFPFREAGIAKGISAYNGNFLPAVNVLFPDGTIQQLDRISDFGFRTNKVIAKANSEIIVAFFPIDRFLTPQLKKMFLESPAVFFVTLAGLADPVTRKKITPILDNILGKGETEKITLMPPKGTNTDDLTEKGKEDRIGNILSGISLNNIQVVVRGVMTVDVDTIPPNINSVSFDPSDVWTKGNGDITGTIDGTFLDGDATRTITVTNASDLGNPTVTVVKDGSNNEQLHFKLSLTSAIPPGQTSIKLKVTKTKDKTTVNSSEFSAPIPASTTPAANTAPNNNDPKKAAQ